MRRREFITLLGGTAAAWPLAAHAQETAKPVVGYLCSTSRDPLAVASFLRGLSEQSYVEGRNVLVEYRFADGNYALLSTLARELVSLPVAVIAAVPSSPAALAAKATR